MAITDREIVTLRSELADDERGRDRRQFSYTIDSLLNSTLVPYEVWPESNGRVAKVISGKVDYDGLPADTENEIYKSWAFPKQQEIIAQNDIGKALCEAQGMDPCKKEQCVLYDSTNGTPYCREFKIAFRKNS